MRFDSAGVESKLTVQLDPITSEFPAAQPLSGNDDLRPSRLRRCRDNRHKRQSLHFANAVPVLHDLDNVR